MCRKLLTALLALCLGGCGFQLQGALITPDAMERTYIATDNTFSLFYRTLHRELSAAGLTLVDSPDEATATLRILVDDTGQRVLSVSARNVPTEYEVYYTVEYAITGSGETLLEAQQLTLTRDYTYDETMVLGKAEEESLLRRAIARDLVRIVMKQISAI